LRKKKLTKDSSPEDWIGELPQDKKKPTDPRSVVTIADWTTYSNTKAMLCNAGMQGGNYPEFTPFSPQEINRFIVPNALQGLTPSPQVISAMLLLVQMPKKRHKHFKAFFSCQDPMLPTPSRKTHPNHKIDNFLDHINRVSMEAWDLGKHLSCDE
jgi:hypothetical protein